MAKLTDSYKNDNLIQIAKQQYETKQRNTIPSEIVTLTSKGKVYPKSSPLSSGKLEMRYMTAYDEDILTNASYIKEGKTLDKLLESLIVSDVKYSDIAAVDKDGLILSARILGYGSKYDVKVKDPKTGNMLDRTVELSNLQTKTLDIDSDENGEFLYETKDLSIKFIFVTIENSNSLTISSLLENIIVEVNGNRKKSDIENFVKYQFLIKDSKNFQKYVVENTPAVIMEHEFEGEDGSTFKAGFPIGPDFFWI